MKNNWAIRVLDDGTKAIKPYVVFNPRIPTNLIGMSVSEIRDTVYKETDKSTREERIIFSCAKYFMKEMRPGDIIVATTNNKAHIGVITSEVRVGNNTTFSPRYYRDVTWNQEIPKLEVPIEIRRTLWCRRFVFKVNKLESYLAGECLRKRVPTAKDLEGGHFILTLKIPKRGKTKVKLAADVSDAAILDAAKLLRSWS